MTQKTVFAITAIMIANLAFADIIDVGSFDTDGTAYEVWVEGDLAYVADGQDGLRIIDISNPEEPEEVGALDTDGTAFSVQVAGDLTYIADGQNGLVIVNIADPTDPQVVGSFSAQMSLINEN